MDNNINKNISDDGILLIDKPMFITSNQAILDVKRKLNLSKVGHAGTLDPLATGLIVLLSNKATKLSDYLLTANKEYQVTMKLFIKTNTNDVLGRIKEIQSHSLISKKQILNALEYFNGFIYEQYPPIFSAIKYNGKKLYEYARKNIDVKIKPRKVTINKIKLLNYNKKEGMVSFYVKCSKGTYVRSLVCDIADKLNTIATVYSLRRLASGNFNITKSKKIKDISKSDFISMYDSLMVNNFPIFKYHDEEAIKYGKMIEIINHSENVIFIVNKNNKLLAIYKRLFEHKYKCIRGI